MASPTELEEKYKLATDIAKGEIKMAYLYGKPFAYLKKHSFSLKTEVEDIASKFSGLFTDKLGGTTSFTIQCDAFVSNTAGHLSATMLQRLAYSGKDHPFEICMSSVKTNSDGSKQILKGDVLMKGRVIITEVGEESEKGSYETLSVTLEGSGELFDGAGKSYGDVEEIEKLNLEGWA